MFKTWLLVLLEKLKSHTYRKKEGVDTIKLTSNIAWNARVDELWARPRVRLSRAFHNWSVGLTWPSRSGIIQFVSPSRRKDHLCSERGGWLICPYRAHARVVSRALSPRKQARVTITAKQAMASKLITPVKGSWHAAAAALLRSDRFKIEIYDVYWSVIVAIFAIVQASVWVVWKIGKFRVERGVVLQWWWWRRRMQMAFSQIIRNLL